MAKNPCTACTFDNPLTATACQICGARLAAGRRPDSQAEWDAAVAADMLARGDQDTRETYKVLEQLQRHEAAEAATKAMLEQEAAAAAGGGFDADLEAAAEGWRHQQQHGASDNKDAVRFCPGDPNLGIPPHKYSNFEPGCDYMKECGACRLMKGDPIPSGFESKETETSFCLHCGTKVKPDWARPYDGTTHGPHFDGRGMCLKRQTGAGGREGGREAAESGGGARNMPAASLASQNASFRSRDPRLARLVQRMHRELPNRLRDLEANGQKTGHWAWWAWPTEKEGVSEPTPRTAVTRDSAAELIERAPREWQLVLEKVCELVGREEKGFNGVIPSIDWNRIHFFVEFWNTVPESPPWLKDGVIPCLREALAKSHGGGGGGGGLTLPPPPPPPEDVWSRPLFGDKYFKPHKGGRKTRRGKTRRGRGKTRRGRGKTRRGRGKGKTRRRIR